MGLISRASAIRSTWIEPYPGFWLNCIGLLIASLIVTSQSFDEEQRLDRTGLAARDKTMECISSYLTGSLSLDRAADRLRTNLAFLLFSKSKPEELILTEAGRPTVLQEDYHDAERFLESLHLRELLTVSTIDGVENTAKTIEQKVKEWIFDRSPILNNRNIYYAWGCMALIYVALVGAAYFRSRLHPSQGEPILNIIDLGLYLTLIEYSGGFASPILYILGLSLTTAILDYLRVSNETVLSLPTIKLFGWQRVLGHYAPTVLYVFSLMTGLIWASLDTAMSAHIPPKTYIFLYAKSCLMLALIGLACFVIIQLLDLLVRQNHLKHQPTYSGQ